MANLEKSHPLNVPGPLFTDTTCIDCGTCYHLGPSLFHEEEKEEKPRSRFGNKNSDRSERSEKRRDRNEESDGSEDDDEEQEEGESKFKRGSRFQRS